MKCQAVLVALCFVVRAAAAEPGPIEAELAKAATAGHPLVVELGATWCAPCQYFKAHVMTEPKVIAAMRDVSYLEYDIDTPVGDAASRRYHAAGVPTFLVLATDGSVSARHLGSISVDQFLGLLAKARGKQATTSELEAAAAAHPDDAAAQLALARHYRSTGQLDLAIERYRAAEAFPAVAAEATAAADQLAAATERIRAVIDQDVAFVEKFPASARASPRLARIAVSGRVDAEHFRALATMHLAAVAKPDLPNAVRASLLGGATEQVLAAIHDWQVQAPQQPEPQLIEAEAQLLLGERAGPMLQVKQVCGARSPGVEAWCVMLAKGTTPIIDRMREVAQAYLRDLVDPGDHPKSVGYPDLETSDPAFANAIARAVGDAQKRCADVEHASHQATVTLAINRGGGKPTALVVRAGGDYDLASCLDRALASLELPKPAVEVESAIVVPVALDESSQLPAQASRPIPSSAIVGLASSTDRGAGLTTSGIVDLHVTRLLRLVGSWHGEVDGRHTYVGRVLVGIAVAKPNGETVTLSAGIGASKLGDTSPYATEVPFEVGFVVPSGLGNVHLWVQTATMVHVHRSNEIATGFGIGRNNAIERWLHVPLFFGETFEHRDTGDTLMTEVSFSFGRYY